MTLQAIIDSINGNKKTITTTVKPSTSTMITWVSDLTNKFNSGLTNIILALQNLQTQIDTKTGTTVELTVSTLTLPSDTTVRLATTNATISYDLNVPSINIPNGNPTILNVENLTIGDENSNGSYTPPTVVRLPEEALKLTLDHTNLNQIIFTALNLGIDFAFLSENLPVDGKGTITVINTTGNDLPFENLTNISLEFFSNFPSISINSQGLKSHGRIDIYFEKSLSGAYYAFIAGDIINTVAWS